jgi:hypothetical protein
MSENSKNFPDLSWGTPESYWPLPRPLAEPEPEDRARLLALTPGQRIEWLVMILRHLEVQFGHLVKNEQMSSGATQGAEEQGNPCQDPRR